MESESAILSWVRRLFHCWLHGGLHPSAEGSPWPGNPGPKVWFLTQRLGPRPRTVGRRTKGSTVPRERSPRAKRVCDLPRATLAALGGGQRWARLVVSLDYHCARTGTDGHQSKLALGKPSAGHTAYARQRAQPHPGPLYLVCGTREGQR